MPNWLQIFQSLHAKAHPDDGYNLVTRPPATERELEELGKALGIKLPPDFRSLYLACNGFGVAHQNEPDKIDWFFRPTDQLQSFTNDVRGWFRETHENYALRFFPFIDFGNGDGNGYVLDDSGTIMDGLFCFEHESYEFDEDQDVNEFITHTPVSLEEFLIQIVG